MSGVIADQRLPYAKNVPDGETTTSATTVQQAKALEQYAGLKPTPTSYQKGEPDWKLNPAKEGVDSDDCPNPTCGNRDVEPAYRLGGTTIGSQEEYRFATTFTCPCCRTTWDRRTAQGAAQRAQKGLNTRRLDGAASSGRTYFLSPNTESYRENYRRAFKHD